MQHRSLPHDRSFAALFRPDETYPYFAGSDSHYAIHCWNACVDARAAAVPAG